MKIGLVGTSCTGKTTLVKQLTNYYHFNAVIEIVRKYHYKHEELTNINTQYQILLRQIYNELISGKNIISDRTVIDNYVYLERISGKSGLKVLNLVRSWIRTYDLIILCPRENIQFKNDGFRLDVNIEQDLIQFMKCNYIEYKKVSGGINERFEQTKKLIENLNENN